MNIQTLISDVDTLCDDEAASGGLEFVDRWSFDVVLRTECLPVPSTARPKPRRRPARGKSVRPAGKDAAASPHASPRRTQ